MTKPRLRLVPCVNGNPPYWWAREIDGRNVIYCQCGDGPSIEAEMRAGVTGERQWMGGPTIDWAKTVSSQP